MGGHHVGRQEELAAKAAARKLDREVAPVDPTLILSREEMRARRAARRTAETVSLDAPPPLPDQDMQDPNATVNLSRDRRANETPPNGVEAVSVPSGLKSEHLLGDIDVVQLDFRFDAKEDVSAEDTVSAKETVEVDELAQATVTVPDQEAPVVQAPESPSVLKRLTEQVQRTVDHMELQRPLDVKTLIGEGAFGKVLLAHERPAEHWKGLLYGNDGPPRVVKMMRELPQGEGTAEGATLAAEDGLIPTGDPDIDEGLAKFQHKRMEAIRRQAALIEGEVEATRALGMLRDVRRVVDATGERMIAMVMDYVPDQELRDVVQNREAFESPEQAHAFRGSMAIAFENLAAQINEDMHGNGWIHRDLKPANVRMDVDVPMRTRAIDMGAAKRIEDVDPLGENVGTPAYMSPDRMAGRLSDPRKDDMYAWGLMLLEAYDAVKRIPGDMFAIARGEHLKAMTLEEVQEHVTRQTGVPLTESELEIVKLGLAIVQPGANGIDGARQRAWRAYAGGAGLDMDMVQRSMDDALTKMSQEGALSHLRYGELEELRMEVEANARRDAIRIMDQVTEMWAAYSGDHAQEIEGELAVMRKTFSQMNDRNAAETVLAIGQDVLAMMGVAPVSSEAPGQPMTDDERAEIDALVAEADEERRKRVTGEHTPVKLDPAA